MIFLVTALLATLIAPVSISFIQFMEALSPCQIPISVQLSSARAWAAS
jgi:hypothetical protein